MLRCSRWAAALAVGLVVAPVGNSPAAADTYRDQQWHISALNIAEAHKISQGDGVVVAVIDSGVKADHRDLVGNILDGVDLTGKGSKGLVDEYGHGTAMVGLIAGHGSGPG